MFKMPEKITYALPESIGNTDLFVGRKKEFNYFLGEWYRYLLSNMAKSQVILSRRKKGKTSFLQRLFNILWSSKEDLIIPVYYTIRGEKFTLRNFSKDYFKSCVYCILSFRQKSPELLRSTPSFEQIPKLTKDRLILDVYDGMIINEEKGDWQSMWIIASGFPQSYALTNNKKIVQIIDEFQNINGYIYDQRGELDNTMSGTYLDLAEKKEAPLIISGSEVHWLMRIVDSLTGRFAKTYLQNLPYDEAIEAIGRYSEFSGTKTDIKAKEKIWNLTGGDPLYIKAIFMNRSNDTKDYSKEENIIETYGKEISPGGEIYDTWMEYIQKTLGDVNKRNSKRIILYLFQSGEERTRKQITEDLKLEESESEIEKKLQELIAGDLISKGDTAFDYKIGMDKTYELVFRKEYQKEIDLFIPDIKAELRKQMGTANYNKGKYAEYLLRTKLKKPFNLKDITYNGKDLKIIPKDIKEVQIKQTGIKKFEIDLVVEGEQEIWIDIKDTKRKYGKRELERILEIKEAIGNFQKEPVLMVYSENGFTERTKETLEKENIYYADKEKIFKE